MILIGAFGLFWFGKSLLVFSFFIIPQAFREGVPPSAYGCQAVRLAAGAIPS